MMRRILVTGARGFVGQELCAQLLRRGYSVRRASRSPFPVGSVPGIEEVCVGEIDGSTCWHDAMVDVDGVIHLAARVHQMGEREQGRISEYRRVNFEGTRRLAEQAAAGGVRRLVFVSSIKVNGEATAEAPFRPEDPPRPTDPYGISKWEAEQAVWRVAQQTAMQAVIIRPPLVYGPGVRANFLQLVRAVDRGIPLPLGAVFNQRSLIYVGNLAAALIQALEHSGAAGRTFLVSDGHPLSTPELIRKLADALGRPARLVPVPKRILLFAGTLFGRRGEMERLCGDLVVDDGAARTLLGWTPPFSVVDGLKATAGWYHDRLRCRQ